MHCLQKVGIPIVKPGGTHCNHFKARWTIGTYTIHAEERKRIQNISPKNLKERVHLADTVTEGKLT